MLKFAIDESASPRVFSVTGVLSSMALWSKLEDSWGLALTDAGPDIRVFHMSDFENRRPPFDTLSNDRRIKLISALIDSINAIRPMIISARLELPMADSILPTDIRQADRLKLLYVVCFSAVYGELYRWLRDETVFECGPVPLVLDRNHDVHHMITTIDASLRKAHPQFDDILGPLVFDGRERCVSLQVADAVAYEVMKHMDNRILANGKTRRSYQRLMKIGSIREYDEPDLRSTIERITHGEFRLSS